MEYLVKFSIDTDDGLIKESHNANALYVSKWFAKISRIIYKGDDDLLIDIDPFEMKLVSVVKHST